MNIADVKKRNRNQVYRLVYEHKRLSKTEIASALRISVPTVSQCVNELKGDGLVADDGFFQSSGGRKAAVISPCPQFRLALGVEIRKEYVHMVAIDLYGEILKEQDFPIPFSNSDYYCAQLCNLIQGLIIDLHVRPEELEGIGFAIQGLTDPATQTVFFGRILDADGFSVENLQKYLAFPCHLQHDTEAAAQYAIWKGALSQDLLYLVLNPYVGGSVAISGELHSGPCLASGLIEHMVLVPGGRQCYCGKRGCVDAYCSSNQLLDSPNGEIGTFFERLRRGDTDAAARWQTYLGYLAQTIHNYHMVLNTEVVLGGLVAKYMNQDDVALLTERVSENSGIQGKVPPITVSKHYDAAAGAALYFIRTFLRRFET